MGLGVCMCAHVRTVCMHLQRVYVCTCVCQTCMCLCVPVCMCAYVSGQTRTLQVGVLAPWPLGGGASMDTLMLGTCRVTIRLSCPEEGHMLLG